jgi:hypothetical protein
MKEIRIIKTFYIWRNTGKIDTKVEIHRVDNEGNKLAIMGWIQKEERWREMLADLVKRFPTAKVRWFNLQKDERIKHRFKVLSEDLKLKLGL